MPDLLEAVETAEEPVGPTPDDVYADIDRVMGLRAIAGVPRLAAEVPLTLAPQLPYYLTMHGATERNLDGVMHMADKKLEVVQEFMAQLLGQGLGNRRLTDAQLRELNLVMTRLFPQEPERCRVINQWWCEQRMANVVILEDVATGRRRMMWTQDEGYPLRHKSMIMMLDAARSLSAEAERTAQETLRTFLTLRQWHHYQLLGYFLESSPRSKVVYMFRRLAPTIAMSVSSGATRILTTLCLHPIGHYEGTALGVMVPSDDVLAHLVMMRGDERRFWSKAVHHHPREAAARI
jgi:hypothetical protein